MSETLKAVAHEKLLRQGIACMSNYYKQRKPLWVVVMDLTTYGSTSSKDICHELGWDPDAPATKELPRRKEQS